MLTLKHLHRIRRLRILNKCPISIHFRCWHQLKIEMEPHFHLENLFRFLTKKNVLNQKIFTQISGAYLRCRSPIIV